MAVDDLASDLGDSAINPATAQPIISFLIHPPISMRPRWAELAKTMSNWLRGGIAYSRQFGVGCQAKSFPCGKPRLKNSLYGLIIIWLPACFQAIQSKYLKGQTDRLLNLSRQWYGWIFERDVPLLS
jgi:hypothetical protein